MSANGEKLRWGILGTAQIARKNWRAIRETGNGTLVAVASRDAARCNNFIEECQSEVPYESKPKAYSSYEELLADDAVQAVYIPLPTGLRKDWVLKAAAAKKHVVCEKPCAVSLGDLKEMVSACRENRVQFMDAVMFVHSRRLERMREVLNDGRSVGELRRIESAFSFMAPAAFYNENIRADVHLEPHGCLGDLGWYCLRLSLWAMNWRMPRQVTGRILAEQGKTSAGRVPTEFSGELLFESGVSAGYYCSFRTADEEWFKISGTEGCLQASDFVLPFDGEEAIFEARKNTFDVKGCDFRMKTSGTVYRVPEQSHGHESSQETNLFRNFSRQVLSGQLNPAWPDEAIKTQALLTACLQSARNAGQVINLA